MTLQDVEIDIVPDWHREALRRELLHQDGLTLAAALAVLRGAGLFESLEASDGMALDSLREFAPTITGSLRVCLGVGILKVERGEGSSHVRLEGLWSRETNVLGGLADLHDSAAAALRDVNWQDGSDLAKRLFPCLERVGDVKQMLRRQSHVDLASRYAEGVIATILLPRFEQERWKDPLVAPMMKMLEFADEDGELTPLGTAASFLQPMYGLGGSYADILLRLPQLLSTDPLVIPALVNQSIDRRVNVIASGAAHRTYFQAAHALIRRVFNEEPVESQPRAIMDVGCGDGTWLQQLHEIVARDTLRGSLLDQYPLQLIGVDFDSRSLGVTGSRLAHLPITTFEGDVAKPHAIFAELARLTDLRQDDVLQVRSFVDHNRLINVSQTDSGNDRDLDVRHMVYVDRSGRRLDADTVRRDWINHLAAWREVCGKHGRVVIEGHALEPEETAARRGESHSLAFEFHHTLSGQSPLPWTDYQLAIEEAGWCPVRPAITFPRATNPTISVQHIMPSPEG